MLRYSCWFLITFYFFLAARVKDKPFFGKYPKYIEHFFIPVNVQDIACCCCSMIMFCHICFQNQNYFTIIFLFLKVTFIQIGQSN